MEREVIILSDDELSDFDFTSTHGAFNVRGDLYYFVGEIRTDDTSDGESWETIVQRDSDDKFFKWDTWDSGSGGYLMSDGDNTITEVFPESKTNTIYT